MLPPILRAIGLDSITSVLSTIIMLYGQIVAIMNPFTAVNNFVTLTEGLAGTQSRRVLREAMLAVLAIGLLFIFAGKAILAFYHVSLYALKLGGGVLLMYIAIDMLGGSPRSKAVEPGEIAVVPLATPMIVGPGTMTLLIDLGASYPWPHVISAFLLSAATVATALYSANYLQKMLGRNGIKAMARFMALIIAAVAANMIFTGIASWAKQALPILITSCN